jgi:hypothetical protein
MKCIEKATKLNGKYIQFILSFFKNPTLNEITWPSFISHATSMGTSIERPMTKSKML